MAGLAGGPTAGAGNGGAAGSVSGNAGAGGVLTAGAGGAAAGLGGVGGTPVLTLPWSENFDDGNTRGWTLYFANIYTSSLLPGSGAQNTARSLYLTKGKVTGFCCDGYYQQFPEGLVPKTASFWLRSDFHGVAAGYVRLGSTTDTEGWIVYVCFYSNALYVVGAQSIAYVYEPGEWYHVELRDISFDDHTFEVWIDGTDLGSIGMNEAASSIRRIDLFNRDADPGVTAPVAAYFDEIELLP